MRIQETKLIYQCKTCILKQVRSYREIMEYEIEKVFRMLWLN